VVYSESGPNLLADVKGRKLEGRATRGGSLQNWIMREDLDSLARWESVFGSGFTAMLVFCYHLVEPQAAARFEVVHLFRGEYYGLVGVYRQAYGEACRTRSRAWDTVSVPAAAFRGMARPISSFF
jgi:hypothetical protein